MNQITRRKGSSALKARALKQDTKDNRVVSYIRSSTKEQVNSLDAQKKSHSEFAQSKGITIAEAFIEQTSATKGSFIKRPEVKRMIKFMKKENITTILLLRIDRAFRSNSDFYQAIAELDQLGIQFRIIDMDLDFTTPSGKLMLTIFVGVAEFESKLRSIRQLDAFETMRDQRIPRNNNPPYGWRIGPNPDAPKGKLLYPIPAEQKILKWIMSEHDRGCLMSHIADTLNESNIPTKKAGQFIRGKQVIGKWHHLTVQSVIEHALIADDDEIAAAEAEAEEQTHPTPPNS